MHENRFACDMMYFLVNGIIFFHSLLFLSHAFLSLFKKFHTIFTTIIIMIVFVASYEQC